MKMINKIKNKIINYHPSKWEVFCFLLVPILFGIIRSTHLDNDTWFILNYGRYILNHGFPTVDPFTIHEGLNLVIQQWLIDILFYKVYSLFGNNSLYFIVNLVNIYLVFITYQLLMLVTNKKRNLSVLFTTIIVTLFDLYFLTSRPQIFSASLLLTELYILEKYEKTKDKRVLLFLPLLSLIMINCHASMWLMLFCFCLPFFINTFSFKVGKVVSVGGKKIDFIIPILGMIIAGFINPYGIKAMTYVLTSYNIPWIYNMVGEMKIPSIHSLVGFTSYFIVFSIYLTYVVFVTKKNKIYHLLLLIGTTYLAISSNRGVLFLIISSIYPISYYIQNKFYVIKEPSDKLKKKAQFLFSVLCILVLLTFLYQLNNSKVNFSNSIIDGVNDMVEQENINDIRLFCHYDDCNYAEYLGIKTYSDSRAEIFLKANNKKEDILKELYELGTMSDSDIEKFLEKYQFTHLIVRSYSPLYEYLVNNDNYQVIYTKNDDDLKKMGVMYKIFKKI